MDQENLLQLFSESQVTERLRTGKESEQGKSIFRIIRFSIKVVNDDASRNFNSQSKAYCDALSSLLRYATTPTNSHNSLQLSCT